MDAGPVTAAPIDLVPPGRTPRLWLFALGVVLPAVFIVGALAYEAANAVPPASVADGVSTSLIVTLAGLALLWLVLDRLMQRHRLELEADRLKVRTSFYSIDLAISELKLDAARVVDLEERAEFRPSLKANGYALPGFKSGHFILGNGDKAFVAVAGERRALWLPTTRGTTLLLQPRQPDALLSRLRELANPTPRR